MNTLTGTGILQVAFGRKYVEEAIEAARTVKAVMPDTPIALVTDAATPEAEALFDIVKILPLEKPAIHEKFWGFYNKICGIEASPFERTLFLDVDIHCAADVHECFTMLSKKAMVVVPIPPRDRPRDALQRANPLPPMNTGVLGLNMSLLPETFFSAWKQMYLKACPTDPTVNFGDQTVFCQLVWEQDVNFLLLDFAYNFRFTKPAMFSGMVKLLHGRAGNKDYVARLVNLTTEPRIYIPNSGLLVNDPATREWVIYPYDAPEEPSRLSSLQLSELFILAVEETGLDEEAADKVMMALKSA